MTGRTVRRVRTVRAMTLAASAGLAPGSLPAAAAQEDVEIGGGEAENWNGGGPEDYGPGAYGPEPYGPDPYDASAYPPQPYPQQPGAVPPQPGQYPAQPSQPGAYPPQPGFPQPAGQAGAQAVGQYAGQWQCRMTMSTQGRGGNSHAEVAAQLFVQPTGQFQAQGTYTMMGQAMPLTAQGQTQMDGQSVVFGGQGTVQSMMGPQPTPFVMGGTPSPDGRLLTFQERGPMQGGGQYDTSTQCERTG